MSSRPRGEPLIPPTMRGNMDLSHLFDGRKLVEDQIRTDTAGEVTSSFFDGLDPGRQQDVIDCIFAIRTSKNPIEKEKARDALRAIYQETQNKKLWEARKWYLNEKDQGRFDNAKNFLLDVEKRPDIYNPNGSRR